MAGQIKGITIEFDADTTKLNATLNKIKAEAKGADNALREVNRQLRFDPKNTEMLKQKQEILRQKIDDTKLAFQRMNEMQKQADAKKVDKHSAAYMKLRREITACAGQLKYYNAQLAKTKFASLKNTGAAIQDVGRKLTRATRYARMFALALTGIALYKGFERLKSLDEVSKQLEVLGYRGEKLEKIMGDVSGSVNGTRFMLQDMAKVATGALGSGVTDKYDLNDYLTRTADLAQLAGIDVQSMGAMMNKAYSKGKVDAKIMNQLNSHGIPIYKLMQKELGVTADELQKMSKEGKLSFDDLYRATDRYQGLAQKMGTETLPGAMTVLTQQFGLAGADFLSGFYEPIKEGTRGIVQALKDLRQNGTFKEWGQDVGDVIKYFVQYFKEGAASTDQLSERAQNFVKVLTPLVSGIGKVVELLAKLPPELQGVLVFMTLIGGPLLTAVGGGIKVLADMGTQIYTIGLNAKAGVGPVGALTSSIGGMSGAASILLNPLTLATLAVGAWALGVKKANDELHASTQAFEEWQEGTQKTIDAAQASGSEVDLYKAKLDELIGKEEKSAGEKQLIKTYVDKLNGAIDGLNLKYDEEKDKLNKTTKAIEKKIEKYKEAALVKAYEDLITEAARKEAEEQLKLADLYEERTKIQEKYENSVDKSWATEQGYLANLNEVNAKIKDSKNAIKGYRGEMDKAENAVKGLSAGTQKEMEKTAKATKTGGANAAKGLSDGVKSERKAVQKASKQLADAAEHNIDNLPGSFKDVGRDMGAGMKNGIMETVRGVASAAAKMAADAVKSAKRAAEESSPSKATRRIGRYFGLGFALGIEDEIAEVRAASGSMVRSALQSATTPAATMTMQSAGGAQITNNWYVNGADDPNSWGIIAAQRMELELNTR